MALRLGTTHWLSPQFPDDYVRSLRNQFGSFKHELTVLGNGADYDRELKSQRQVKFTNKLEWFAPWNADLRPAVVFDLDTYIVGDPEPFLHVTGDELWLIRQFYQKPGKGESGIFIAPDSPLSDVIWNRATSFDPNGADGALLREFPHRFLPDVIDGIYSYKVHQLYDGYPEDAVAICFHGKPRPHETEGWALDHWLTSLH